MTPSTVNSAAHFAKDVVLGVAKNLKKERDTAHSAFMLAQDRQRHMHALAHGERKRYS